MAEQHHHHHYHHHGGAPPVPPRFRVQQQPMRMEGDYPEEGVETAVHPYQGQPQEGAPIIMYRGQRLGELDEEDCSMLEVGLYCPYCTGAFTAKFVHQKPVQLPIGHSGSFEHILQDVQAHGGYDESRSPPYDPMLKQDVDRRHAPQVYVEQKQMHYSIKRNTGGRSEKNVLRQMKQWDGRGEPGSSPGELSPDGEAIHSKYSKSATHIYHEGSSYSPNTTGSQSTEEIHRKSESRYHYKSPRQYSYKSPNSPQGSCDTVIQKTTSSSRSSKGHSKSESSDHRRKDSKLEMKHPQRKEKRHSADVGMKYDAASAEKFLRETRSHSPGSVQRVPDVYPEHSTTDEEEQIFVESMPDFDYNYRNRHFKQSDYAGKNISTSSEHRQLSEQQSEIAQVLQQRKMKLDKRDPRTFEQQQQMAKEIYVPPPPEHRHSFHMPQYVKITPVQPQEHMQTSHNAPIHEGQMSSARYVSRVPSSPGSHQDFESSIDSVQSRSDYGSMGSSSYTPPYDEGAHLRGGNLSVFDQPYSREGSTSLASSHSSVSSATYSQYKKYSSTETVLQQTAHAKTPERQSAETINVTKKAPYNKENVAPIPDFCAKEFNMNSPTSPARKHRELEKGGQSGVGKRNWVEIETDNRDGNQGVPIKKEKMDEKTTPPKSHRLSTEEEALKSKIDALCSQMNQRKNIEIIVQGDDDEEEFGYDFQDDDELDPNSLAQDIIRGADVRDRISPHRLSAASSAESVNRRHNVIHGSTDSEDVFNRSGRFSDHSFSESDHQRNRSAQFSATSYEDNESISTRSSTSFHYDLVEGAVTTGSAVSTPTTSEADSHDGMRSESVTDPILQNLEDDIKREEINLEMTTIADNIRWLNQQEHGPMLPFDLLQRQKMILMEEKERQLAAEAKVVEKAEKMKQRTIEREKQEFLKKEDKAIRLKMKEDKKRKKSKKTPPKDGSERFSDTSSSMTSSKSSRHSQEVETVTEKVVIVKTTEVTEREPENDDEVFVQAEHIPEKERPNSDLSVDNSPPQIVSDHIQLVAQERRRCSSPEEIVDEVLENLDADSYDPNATLERIFTMPRKKKNKVPGGSKQQPYREMSPETIFERIVEGMSDVSEGQFTPDSSEDEYSQQRAEILLTNTLVGLELLRCETKKDSNHTSVECLAGGTDRYMSTPSDTSFEGEDEMMASITSTNTSNLGGVTSDSETSLERLIDNTKSLTENIMATYLNQRETDETMEAIQKEALNIVTTFGAPEGDGETGSGENYEPTQQELVDYVFSPQHEDDVQDPELKKISKSEVELEYLFVKSGDVRFKVGSSAESLSSNKSNKPDSTKLLDSKTHSGKSADRHFKVTLVPLVDNETRDEFDYTSTTTSVHTVTSQTVVTTTTHTTTNMARQAPPDEFDEDRPPAIPPRPKMYTRDSSSDHFSSLIHSDDYDTETTNESVDREESPGLEIDTSPLRAVSSIVNSFNRKHLRYGYGLQEQNQGQIREVDYGMVSPLDETDGSSSSLFSDEMVHANMSEGDISLDEKDQLDLALQMRLEDMLMMPPPEIKEYASSDDLDERLKGLGDESEADLSFGSDTGRELVSPYGDVRLRHLQQPSDGSSEKRLSFSTDDSLQECVVEEEQPGELIHERLEMRDDRSPEVRKLEESDVSFYNVGGVRTEIDRREEETVVTSVRTQEMIVKEDTKKIEESKPVPQLDEIITDRTSPLRTTITTVKRHKIECYETYMGSEDPSQISVKEPSPPISEEQSPPIMQQVSSTTKVKPVQYYETYMGSEDLPEQKAPVKKKKKIPPPVPKKPKKSKEITYEMTKETTFTVSEKGEEIVKTRRVPASPKTSQTEQELRVLNQIDLNTKLEMSAQQEQEVIQQKKKDENEELLYEAIKVIESTLEETSEKNKKEENDKEKESTPSSESMEISENEGTVILADHDQFFDSEVRAKLEHMESFASTTGENELDEYANELVAISFEEALKEFQLIEMEITRIRNMQPAMDTVVMEKHEESVIMETSNQLETINSGFMSPVPLSEQKCSTFEIRVNSQEEQFPTENIKSPPPEDRLPKFIRFDFEDPDSDEEVRPRKKLQERKVQGHTTQMYSTDMVVPVVQRKRSPPEEEPPSPSYTSQKDIPILMSTSLTSEEENTDSAKYTTQVDMSVAMVTERQYSSSDAGDNDDDDDDDDGEDADDEEEEKEMKTVEQIMDVLRRESQSGDFVYEENSAMEELLKRELSESPVFDNIRAVSPVFEVPSRELSQSPHLGSEHSGRPDVLYNAHSLATLSQCAVENINPVLLHIINHPGYREWYKYWVAAMSHNALYPTITKQVVQETVEVQTSHKALEPARQEFVSKEETVEEKCEEIPHHVLEPPEQQEVVSMQETVEYKYEEMATSVLESLEQETEMPQDDKQEVVFEEEKEVPTEDVTVNTVTHTKEEFLTHTFQPTEHCHIDLVTMTSHPDQPSLVEEVRVPSAEDSMVQNIEYKQVKDGNAVQKRTVITQQQKQFRHSYPGKTGPIYPRKPEFVKKKTPPPIPKRIRKSATPEIVQAPPPPQVVTMVTSNTEVKTDIVKKTKKTPPPVPKRIRKQEVPVAVENSGTPNNQRHSQISDTSNSKRSSRLSENSVNVSQTIVNVSQTTDTSNEFITKLVTIQQQEGAPEIPIKIRKQKIPPPIPPRKGREGSVNRERTLSPEPVAKPSVIITEVLPQKNDDQSKVLFQERNEFKKNVVTQPKPVKITAPPVAIDTNENVLVLETHSTTLIQKPEIKQLEASPRMQRKNYQQIVHKTEAPPVVENSTSCDIEISRKMIHDTHPYVDEHIETCKTSTVVAQENIPVIRIHRDGEKNVFSHTKQTDAAEDVTVNERMSFYEESDFELTESKQQDTRTKMLQKTFAEISNGSKGGKPVINDKQAEQFLHTMLGNDDGGDSKKKGGNQPDKMVAKTDSEQEIVLSEDVTTQEITLVFKWPKRKGMPPMRQRPTPFREVHLHRVVKVTDDDDVEVVDGPSVRSLENGKEVYAVSSLRRRKPVKGTEKLKEEIAKQTSQMKQFITGDIINTQPKKQQNLLPSGSKQFQGQSGFTTNNTTQDTKMDKKAESVSILQKIIQDSKQLQKTDSDNKQTTPAQYSAQMSRKTSQGSTTSEPQAQSQNFLTLPESMYKGESDNSDIEGLLAGAVSETDSGEHYHEVMGKVDSQAKYEFVNGIGDRSMNGFGNDACSEDVDECVSSRSNEGETKCRINSHAEYEFDHGIDSRDIKNGSEGQGLLGDVVLCFALLEKSTLGGSDSKILSACRNKTQTHDVDNLGKLRSENTLKMSSLKGFEHLKKMSDCAEQYMNSDTDIGILGGISEGKGREKRSEVISREYILSCLKPFANNGMKATKLEGEESKFSGYHLVDEGFYDEDNVTSWVTDCGEGEGRNIELWERKLVMDEIHSLSEVINRYGLQTEPLVCNMMYRSTENEDSRSQSHKDNATGRCKIQNTGRVDFSAKKEYGKVDQESNDKKPREATVAETSSHEKHRQDEPSLIGDLNKVSRYDSGNVKMERVTQSSNEEKSEDISITKLTSSTSSSTMKKEDVLKESVSIKRTPDTAGDLYTIREERKEIFSGTNTFKKTQGNFPSLLKPQYRTSRKTSLRKAASETVIGPEVEVKSKLEKNILSSSMPLFGKGTTGLRSPGFVQYDILKQYLTSKHGKKSHVVDALRHCFSLESLAASVEDVSVIGEESRDILGLGLEPGAAFMDPKIDIDYPMGVVINPQALQRLEDILLGRLYRAPKYEDLHAAIESLNVDIPYSMEDLDLDTLSELLQIGYYSASSEEDDEFLGSPAGGDDDVFENEYIDTFIDFSQEAEDCLDTSDSTVSGTMTVPGHVKPVDCLETSFTEPGQDDFIGKEASEPVNKDNPLDKLLFEDEGGDEGLFDFCGELDIVDGKVTSVNFFSKPDQDETAQDSNNTTTTLQENRTESYENYEEMTTKTTETSIATHANETKHSEKNIKSSFSTASNSCAREDRCDNEDIDIKEDTTLNCPTELKAENDNQEVTFVSPKSELPLSLGNNDNSIKFEHVGVETVKENQIYDDGRDVNRIIENRGNDKTVDFGQIEGSELEDNQTKEDLNQEDTCFSNITDREFFSSIDSVVESTALGQDCEHEQNLNDVKCEKKLEDEYELNLQDLCSGMEEEGDLGELPNSQGICSNMMEKGDLDDKQNSQEGNGDMAGLSEPENGQNGNDEQIISEDRYMICVRMDFTYKKKPKMNSKAVGDNKNNLVEVEKNMTNSDQMHLCQFGELSSPETLAGTKVNLVTNPHSIFDLDYSTTEMQGDSLRLEGEKYILEEGKNEDSGIFEKAVELDGIRACENAETYEEVMNFDEDRTSLYNGRRYGSNKYEGLMEENNCSSQLDQREDLQSYNEFDGGTRQLYVRQEEEMNFNESIEPQDGGTSQHKKGQRSESRESNEKQGSGEGGKAEIQSHRGGGSGSGGDGGEDGDRNNERRRLDVMSDMIEDENEEDVMEEEAVEMDGEENIVESDMGYNNSSQRSKDVEGRVLQNREVKKEEDVDIDGEENIVKHDMGYGGQSGRSEEADRKVCLKKGTRSQKMGHTKIIKSGKEKRKLQQKEEKEDPFWNQYLFDSTNIAEDSVPEKLNTDKGKKGTISIDTGNKVSHTKSKMSSKKLEKYQYVEGNDSKTTQKKTVTSKGKKAKKQNAKELGLAVRDQSQKEAEIRNQGLGAGSDTFWQEFLYMNSSNTNCNPYFESHIPVDNSPTLGFQEHQFWHRYLYAQRKSGHGVTGVGGDTSAVLSQMMIGEEIKQKGKRSTSVHQQTVTRGKKVHFDIGVAEHVGEGSKAYMHRSQKVIGKQSVKTLRSDGNLQFDMNFPDDMGQKVKGHLSVDNFKDVKVKEQEQTKSKKNSNKKMKKQKKEERQSEHENVLNVMLQGFGSHNTMATNADTNTRVENEDHATQCSFTSFEYGEASESVTVGSQTQQMEVKASVETHNVFVMVPSQLSFGAMNLPGLTQNIPTLMPFQMPTPQSFGQSFFPGSPFGVSSSEGDMQSGRDTVLSHFDSGKASACQGKASSTTVSTQTQTSGLSTETTDTGMSAEKESERCSADVIQVDTVTEEQDLDISTDIQQSAEDKLIGVSTDSQSSNVSIEGQQLDISEGIGEGACTENSKLLISTEMQTKKDIKENDPEDKDVVSYDDKDTSVDDGTASNAHGTNDPRVDKFVVSIHMTPTCVGRPAFEYKIKAEDCAVNEMREDIGVYGVSTEETDVGKTGDETERYEKQDEGNSTKLKEVMIGNEEYGKQSGICITTEEEHEEKVEVLVKEAREVIESDWLDSSCEKPLENIERGTSLQKDGETVATEFEQDFEPFATNIETKDVSPAPSSVGSVMSETQANTDETENGDIPPSPIEKIYNDFENKVKDLDFKQYGFIDPKDYFTEAQQEHKKEVEALSLGEKNVFYVKNTSETSFEHVLTDPKGFKSTQKSSAYEEKEWSEDDEKPKYKTTQEVLLKPALGGSIEVKRDTLERQRKSSVSIILESNTEDGKEDAVRLDAKMKGSERVQKSHDSKSKGRIIQIIHADHENKNNSKENVLVEENASTKKDTRVCLSTEQGIKDEYTSVMHQSNTNIKECEETTSVRVIHVEDGDVIMKPSMKTDETVFEGERVKYELLNALCESLTEDQKEEPKTEIDEELDAKIFIEGVGELKVLKGKDQACVMEEVEGSKGNKQGYDNTVDGAVVESIKHNIQGPKEHVETAILEGTEQIEMDGVKEDEDISISSHRNKDEKDYDTHQCTIDTDKEETNTEEPVAENIMGRRFEKSEENCSIEKVSIISKSEGYYNHARKSFLSETEEQASCGKEESSSITTGSTTELPPSDRSLEIVKTEKPSDRLEGENDRVLELQKNEDLKFELKSLLSRRNVQKFKVSSESLSYKISPFAGDEFMKRRRLQELVKPQREPLGEWKVESRRFSTSGCEMENMSRYTVPLQVQHSSRRYSTSSVHGPVIKRKQYLKENKVNRGYLEWATERELESLLHSYTRSQQETVNKSSFLDFLENCISQSECEKPLACESDTGLLASNENGTLSDKTEKPESGTGLVANGGGVSSHESLQGIVVLPGDGFEYEDKPFRSAIRNRKSLTDFKTMRKREKGAPQDTQVKKPVITRKDNNKQDSNMSIVRQKESIKDECSTAEIKMKSSGEKETISVGGPRKEDAIKVDTGAKDEESVSEGQQTETSRVENKKVEIVREYLTENVDADGLEDLEVGPSLSCSVTSEMETALTDDVIAKHLEQDGFTEVKVISPSKRGVTENVDSVEKSSKFEVKEGTKQVEIIREYLTQDHYDAPTGDMVDFQENEQIQVTHDDNIS